MSQVSTASADSARVLSPGWPCCSQKPGQSAAWTSSPFAHSGLREGHVVLVADQPAESPEVGVVGPQAGRVASAPDFPLLMGWHQFAMASHQVAVAVEVEHRVVECFAAGSVVEFVRSEDDVAVRIVDGIAEYLDGLVVDAEAVFWRSTIRSVQRGIDTLPRQ